MPARRPKKSRPTPARKVRLGQKQPAERIYQFKITLKYSKPSIWRRIQVEDCSLDRFHAHIQTAMGWTNSHLHQFEICGRRYGDPELLDDGFEDFECVDSTRTRISQFVPSDGKRFRFHYEYDFGDGWEHEILFEGCPGVDTSRQYPVCLEGERACPPEDVGGMGGFENFLAAVVNPKHEDHQSCLEWSGPFDPDAFDAAASSLRMLQGLPDWRKMKIR